MSSLSVRRPGVITGLILLACWLGWLATRLAALGQRPVGDEAAVRALLETLRVRGQLPASGIPTAIHLDATACNCAARSSRSWNDIANAMHALDGNSAQVPAAAPTGGYELLLFAADGSVRYAGPLASSSLVCGRSDPSLASWLPELLSARGPALILPPRCSC